MTTQQTSSITSQTTQPADPGATPIRVFLVDDQPTVRQGLRLRLSVEADLEVVSEARDDGDAIALAAVRHQGVVVLDIAMPGLDDSQTAQALRAVVPGAAIVMLSLHDTPISPTSTRFPTSPVALTEPIL